MLNRHNNNPFYCCKSAQINIINLSPTVKILFLQNFNSVINF